MRFWRIFDFVFDFVYQFHWTKEKAKAIKADPEKQPKSVRFGIASIFSSILCVAFSFALVYGFNMMLEKNTRIVFVIGGLIIGMIGVCGVLSSLYKAIESWAFQIYINKRFITWLSLILWIAAIIATVVLVVLLLFEE